MEESECFVTTEYFSCFRVHRPIKQTLIFAFVTLLLKETCETLETQQVYQVTLRSRPNLFTPSRPKRFVHTHWSRRVVKALRVLHDRKGAGSVLVPRCWPHLHVVQHLEEGEGHAASDDHLIHFVQHVVDQLDLIFHLRSERHRHTSVVEIRDTRTLRRRKRTMTVTLLHQSYSGILGTWGKTLS